MRLWVDHLIEDNKNFNENAIVSCFHGKPTRGAYKIPTQESQESN